MNFNEIVDDMPVKHTILEGEFEFHGSKFKHVVLEEGDALEMFRYYRDRGNRLQRVQVGDFKSQTDRKNVEAFKRSLFEGDVGWCGGSYDDLVHGKPSTTLFKEEQKKFQSSKLYKKIIRKVGETTRRTRIRCEHDGEWDLDSKYEIKPFNRSVRKTGVSGQIVSITADLCFSAMVSSEAINRYGAFVASIVKALESCGINVELYVRQNGTRFLASSSKKEHSFMMGTYKVKSSGDYMPTSLLLKIFSSNFLRRMMHAQIVCSASYIDEEVSGSLGTPFTFGKVWDVTEDSINIYSVPSHEDQKNISEKLLDFIVNDPKKKEEAN